LVYSVNVVIEMIGVYIMNMVIDMIGLVWCVGCGVWCVGCGEYIMMMIMI